MASANVAWNPSERVKLNAYYLFNLEQSKGQYDITRSYWGREAVETMGQATDRERAFHHAGFSMKSMLSAHAALDWRLVLTAMPQSSRNRLGAYAWDEDMDVWNLSHSLSFAKNWNNRNLLSVSSQLLYNHARRTMDVASADSLLYMPELQLHAISQDQRTAMLDHHLAVSWVHRLSKVWQLKMNTTWNLIRSTMSVSSSSVQPAAQEDEDVTRLYGYGISMQKKKGLFRLDVGFDLGYLDQAHSIDKVVLLPNASIELVLSSVNALSLSYSSGYERDNSYFARATILDDYRQMTVYDGKEDLLHKSHNVTLNAHYFNILSDFTWIMNVGCSFTEHPYIPNYDSNGHTTIASWMETDRSHVSQHAYFNIKKGFRFPLVLALKSTLVNTRYQTAYHRQVSRNRFSRAEGELSLTSRLKSSWFNMEVGYRFNFRQSKLGISDSRLSLISYEAYARPFLVRKGRLDVSMPLTFIHDRSGERRYNYFDAGIQASYTAGRWSFSVEGKNLLHTRRFERISVAAENDYMETVVERRLPGYAVVGLKRTF